MRIVQLLPTRAIGEQNSSQEIRALEDAGHDVRVIGARGFGLRGLAWFETVGWRLAAKLRPDVVSCRDLDTLGAGVKVKRRTGAKLVYDMHEVYPLMIADDIPRWMLSYIERRERKLLHEVDLAIASDTGREQWLADQGYVYRPRLTVLNCRDPLPYRPPPNSRVLCYTGTLHRSRFIVEMVKAMNRLSDARLVIAGPRTPNSEYEWLLANAGVAGQRVAFHGRVSPDQALEILQQSDISIQMANPESHINTLGPYNRLFDAMAVGRPSLGTIGTANGDLISNLRIGFACGYDVESYVQAVNVMFDSFDLRAQGLRAHEACIESFNWTDQAKKLVAAYERLR